ncbi:MAG: hypothetical protein K2M12_00705 [Muribaculaceae bacterium]|nr:hypothetical protein [Muribaculaceae bacterium]
MRRLWLTVVAFALLCAAPACRSRRQASVSAGEEVRVGVVRAVSSDSLQLVAVVSVEKPRLTLRPDSGLTVEGERATARVVAGSRSSRTVERTDSAAVSISHKSTDADTRMERPRLWPVVLGLLLIALSWIGIRARR